MARPPSAASRDEVLGAALDILREDGPTALTVRAVAARAGCSTMGVYTHFDGKTGLVDAILAEGHAQLRDALDDGASANAWGDALVSSAVAYRAWALTHPTHYQVMYLAVFPDVEPSAHTKQIAQVGYEAHVARVGEELGIDGPQAERIARHLWASVHGHVQFDVAAGTSVDDATAEATFVESARWLRKGVAP
ncbi:TetR/AcrR family transcriptional regulator [Demequina sp.]|uniref:TetR/AcrR family transcriptional regulator n=1 Tax=Demequina sp. TaxID=2050685 RepID=UPI003D13FEF3